MLRTKISDERPKKTIVRNFPDLNEGEFFISKNDHLCVKVTNTCFLDFNNFTSLESSCLIFMGNSLPLIMTANF